MSSGGLFSHGSHQPKQRFLSWLPLVWAVFGAYTAVLAPGASVMWWIVGLGLLTWGLRRVFEKAGWPRACELLGHTFFSLLWVLVFLGGPLAWAQIASTGEPPTGAAAQALESAANNHALALFLGLFGLVLQSRLMDAKPAPLSQGDAQFTRRGKHATSGQG